VEVIEIRVKVRGNLAKGYQSLLSKYRTDGSSLFRAYLVHLISHPELSPIGYPRRVVLSSMATHADYLDENTVILPDQLKLSFPEHLAERALLQEKQHFGTEQQRQQLCSTE
jgi:hypothetical protein